MFVMIYYPIFISVHIKSQVVLSKGGIFETIFYFSITSYYLSIEKHLTYNQFVSNTNDTGFDWYSKCGGVNDGPKVIFRLKDKKCYIFNPSLIPLELNMKLVYAYGYYTPFMPLSPLKEKILPMKQKLSRLFGSYCIISLNFILL